LYTVTKIDLRLKGFFHFINYLCLYFSLYLYIYFILLISFFLLSYVVFFLLLGMVVTTAPLEPLWKNCIDIYKVRKKTRPIYNSRVFSLYESMKKLYCYISIQFWNAHWSVLSIMGWKEQRKSSQPCDNDRLLSTIFLIQTFIYPPTQTMLKIVKWNIFIWYHQKCSPQETILLVLLWSSPRTKPNWLFCAALAVFILVSEPSPQWMKTMILNG
jgi:hypothetical protein